MKVNKMVTDELGGYWLMPKSLIMGKIRYLFAYKASTTHHQVMCAAVVLILSIQLST